MGIKEMAMNEAQKKEYLDNQGEKCPFCHEQSVGRDFETTEPYAESGFQIREDDVGCWKCKKEWTDIYQLVDIRV